MCRLFGFRSSVPSRAHRSLLNAENALATQATNHPDGWGIGWFVDDDARVIKSSNAAHACNRFRAASRRLTSHTFLVHVRKATVGVIDRVNAHPFRYGRWLFAHNGTIFDMDTLGAWLAERTHPKLLANVQGDTDSERLFYYLLTQLVAAGIDETGAHVSDVIQVGTILRRCLLELDAAAAEQDIERPITNVILTNGTIFIAHRAGMPLLLSTQKRTCAEFLSCRAPVKTCMQSQRPANLPVNHLIVASEPIGRDESVWEEIDDGTTLMLAGDFQLSVVPPPKDWVAPKLPEWARTVSKAC